MPSDANQPFAPQRDQKERVLIVEDSPDVRASLGQQVEALGYGYETAGTCAEARECLQGATYGCTLLDLGLPDGNGMDLLKDFATVAPQTVPVVLTGDSGVETVIETMRAGAFDYLIKPVDMVTLRTAILRAITHHRVVRERAMLVDLLYDEREQLKRRIEEATQDVRAYAESCAASNALLHSLVEMTQLSTGMLSDDSLMRNVFTTLGKHVPVGCLALCDVTQRREFLAAVAEEDDVGVIVSTGEESKSAMDYAMAMAEPDVFARFLVERHTGINTGDYTPEVHLQRFWNRPVCIVACYVEPHHELDEAQQEFLGMCAHFLAFEWQRARLLLHAAHQGSLGNIALELSKSYLHALTAIRTASDLLQESSDTAEAREGLTIISDNVEFLTDRTKAFHSLSRLREDSVETVRLDEYIDQTLSLLESSIKARGITIDKRFETASDCVLLNGTALSRTILDLVSNAVRTVGQNGTVELRLRESDADHIECDIRHDAASATVFGLPTMGDSATLVDLVKGHPSFMLAQRTVHSCGGRLTLERDGESRHTFRITLPRNALTGIKTPEDLPGHD